MNIWKDTFTAEFNAILDIAERELRALLGPDAEIERTWSTVRTSGWDGPDISINFHAGWDHGADHTHGCVVVACSVPGTPTERSALFGTREPNFSGIAADLRRYAAVMALADDWHQRWGGLRWSEDYMHDPAKVAARNAEREAEAQIAKARAQADTDRRREVLGLVAEKAHLSTADRALVRKMPLLVDMSGKHPALTEAGETVLEEVER